MSLHVFDNVDEMAQAIAERAPESRKRRSGSEFTGGASFKQATAMVLTGWQEGRARLVDAVDADAFEQRVTLKPSRVPAVAGGSVRVGAALSGHPYAYNGRRRAERGARVLRVCFDNVASGGVSAAAYEARGLAVCAWIDETERAGVRVEFELVYAATSGWIESETTDATAETQPGKKFVARVMLKRAEEALDLDRMAFWLGHPGAFRQLVFGLIEADAPYFATVGSGLGRPSTYRPIDPEVLMLESMPLNGSLHSALRRDEGSSLDWLRERAAGFMGRAQ